MSAAWFHHDGCLSDCKVLQGSPDKMSSDESTGGSSEISVGIRLNKLSEVNHKHGVSVGSIFSSNVSTHDEYAGYYRITTSY